MSRAHQARSAPDHSEEQAEEHLEVSVRVHEQSVGTQRPPKAAARNTGLVRCKGGAEDLRFEALIECAHDELDVTRHPGSTAVELKVEHTRHRTALGP
jgi:hypothetical protein